MLKKTMLAVALALSVIAAGAGRNAWAQNSGASKAAADDEEKAPGAYRVDFLISELEDGKKINTRQYSMNLKSPDGNEIKIGTRVPVEVKQGEVQYLDVGTNISCRLKDRADMASLGNSVALNVRAELSNFADRDPLAQGSHPAIRQMKIEASTIASVGKPVVLGSADDPNSKRQFQLEVTVTRLR
jgi:hypothetical protein